MAEASSGHSPSGIDVWRIVGLLAIVAAAVIVLAWAIHSAMLHWVTPQHAALVARPAPIPPTPRLQPRPGGDLETLRSQKRALLSQWGWTDASHQFARIPIERAMSLYAQGIRVEASAHTEEGTHSPVGARPPDGATQSPEAAQPQTGAHRQKDAQPQDAQRSAIGGKP